MLNKLFVPVVLTCVMFGAAVSAQAQAKVQLSLPDEPFQVAVNTSGNAWTSISGTNTSGISLSGALTWNIPAGKILVVEHVSARALVNSGEKVTVSITCQSAGVGLSQHQLAMTSQGVFDLIDRLSGSSPLHCYTGSNLIVTFLRNSTAGLGSLPVSAEFSITGYLVDPPK